MAAVGFKTSALDHSATLPRLQLSSIMLLFCHQLYSFFTI